MDDRAGFDALMRRARRREFCALLLSQAGLAAAAAVGGLVLLLVLGTQVLDWHWVVLLLLAGAGLGAYRLVRRLRTPYESAQEMDRRLSLPDTLSTAQYFREFPDTGRGSEAMRDAQRAQTERLSAEIDPSLAFPITVPRTAQVATMLVLVALGIFALRYGLSRSLDLRPPLAASLFPEVFGAMPNEQDPAAGESPKQLPQPFQRAELPGEDFEADEIFSADALAEFGDSMSDAEMAGDPASRHARSNASDGNSASDSDFPGANVDPEAPQQGQERADNPPPAAKPSRPTPEESNLIKKLRDAMAELLARLKIEPDFGEGQESTDMQSALQSGRQSQSLSPQGADSPGREQAERASSGDALQEGQEGEGEQGSQGARAKSDGTGDEQAGGQDGTGMGRDDGSKELREAARLEAMGKISEILGKRAADVSGEVMVEVASGRQQLRTPYSESAASPSTASGDMQRAEIPLVFQHYVQQYFEEVRKPAAESGPAGNRR